MAITYEYAVKYNGKYYPPNTPIDAAVKEKSGTPVEKPKTGRGRVSKGKVDTE